MTNGFMNKTIVRKIPVTDSNWIITEYDDNSFSCNCPAWIFHKGERVNCKHINNFLNFQVVLQKVGENGKL